MKKLFIHIPKNAGLSIKRSPAINTRIQSIKHKGVGLQINCREAQSYLQRIGEAYGLGHARWIDLDKKLKRMVSFAVVRNPWDRTVSRYCFAKKLIEVEKVWPSTYADISSFEAFLEERHKWGDKEYLWFRAIKGWYPNFDHVTDKQGAIQCDIIRFEKLDKDLQVYFNINSLLKARNVTNDSHGKILRGDTYKEVYTPQTIQIVADWYEKDIACWGFDFDTGAKRNYWNQ